MGRECRVILVAGKKGVGKTVETVKMIYNYVKGTPNKPPRKALIFDVNDEFSSFWYFGQTHSVKAISLKDITKFSMSNIIEVRRIRPFFDDGKRMTINDMTEVLGIILEQYRNGLLLEEDINKYTGDYMQVDLIGALATARHVGLDVIAHFQGVGRLANPKLVGNCNFIRLHKCNDTIKRHEKKFEEKTEIMQLAEIIINNRYKQGDTRFFLYVDVDNSKVLGAFTQAEIDTAVQEYVELNQKKLLHPILNKRDLNGNKLNDYNSAITSVINNLKEEYFSK